MNTGILFLLAWIGLVSSAAFAAESDTSKIKCSEMGTKFAAQFKKQYTSEISIWGNPEFHYSTRMNTCLVYTEVISGALDKQINATWYYRRVTDISRRLQRPPREVAHGKEQGPRRSLQDEETWLIELPQSVRKPPKRMPRQ